MISGRFVFGFCAFVAAYMYYSPPGHEKRTLQYFQSEIRQPVVRFHRVAVGVNAGVDLIVSATELLQGLGMTPSQTRTDHLHLDSLQDLEEAVAYYMEKGAAGERYMGDGALFQQIVAAAEKLPDKKVSIGGNAALMGERMADMGVQVLLGGPMGPQAMKLLSSSVQVPRDCIRARDEVHLILEFGRGEAWGDVEAAVATRFIFSNDVSNARMEPLEAFFGQLEHFRPDLVVLSGLHLLEKEKDSFRQARLARVVHVLRNIPDGIAVHLELASMVDTAFLKKIAAEVFPVVHSIGLNEQELAFLCKSVDGPLHAEVLDGGQPEIPAVNDILFWLLQTYGYSEENPTSRFSRIHFHSLTFHVTAALPAFWGNLPSATAAGSLVAPQQACGEDGVITHSETDIKIPLAFPLSVQHPPLRREIVKYSSYHPVTSWVREGVEFAFSPVLVCKKPIRTVGLGDAISATGLLYSQFKGTQ
ncbi:PREDICTED: ADP-dependent glucokinase-like [Branchiostoma belcheri]|uniref:ADP-dependent glucokinase-like n=1 Tax=Branchiostoma belcheri TaxID=7741 RepID=A0A6P5AF00_BRABE|nr:PREDICTED: ADP-dependent glucokinase-like [Branchiostoma belcheri]